MYGSTEQEIPLDSVPIWIHLTYQTAFVDDEGKLQIRRTFTISTAAPSQQSRASMALLSRRHSVTASRRLL